ncbi:MAG: diguanylate cyclase [Alphaproteobacteria bacterium]|nr:diguanylate cyclase [Alphaproteobacteria bacterium]
MKSPLHDADTRVNAVLTSSLDITARKRTEAHLRHMAHHDALTDLPNRTFLRERTRKLIARARRGNSRFAVHVIDLDGFKSVNDLLGHAAGDRFIKQIAKKLLEIIREEDTLARLGGDEFAVVQTDVASEQDAAAFAQRLLDAIEQNVRFEDMPVTVTASIGIAIHPDDGVDFDTLIKHADLAMYQSKTGQGNRFNFYASDMNARARQMAQLDARIRRAIDRRKFVLYYQPQINLRTGEISGAEALLRWNDPELGMVPSVEFLPRAEENGLIANISEWVLELRWCRFLRQGHKVD